MGDSISDLIDENQKAAEALLVHVEKTLGMTSSYDKFLDDVINLANHDGIYQCKETLKDVHFAFEDMDAKLQKNHDSVLEHLASAHEKAVESTAQLRRLSDEIISTTQNFSSEIEKKNTEAGQFKDAALAQLAQIDEHWTKIAETLDEKRDESIQFVDQLSDVIEEHRNEIHDRNEKLETDLQELATSLDEYSAHLDQIFQDLADTGDNKMQSITGSINTLPGAADLKENLHKEFEQMHAEIEEVNGKLLEKINDLLETAGKGQRALHEGVSNVQEQIEGVSGILDEVQPLLNQIEDIG